MFEFKIVQKSESLAVLNDEQMAKILRDNDSFVYFDTDGDMIAVVKHNRTKDWLFIGPSEMAIEDSIRDCIDRLESQNDHLVLDYNLFIRPVTITIE